MGSSLILKQCKNCDGALYADFCYGSGELTVVETSCQCWNYINWDNFKDPSQKYAALYFNQSDEKHNKNCFYDFEETDDGKPKKQ
jgi:hypothetical protein